MAFVVQCLTRVRPPSKRRWQSIATAKRFSVAESIMRGFQVDKRFGEGPWRIKPFVGRLSHCHHLED
jgi:hypothetical protein